MRQRCTHTKPAFKYLVVRVYVCEYRVSTTRERIDDDRETDGFRVITRAEKRMTGSGAVSVRGMIP